MELDIRECLELRAAAGLDSRDDELVSYYLQEGEGPEIAMVVHPSLLGGMHGDLKDRLLSSYDISGVFDIGSPYLETSVNVVLLTLVRKGGLRRKSIKVANWRGCEYDRRRNHSILGMRGGLTLPERFSDEYDRYLSMIESWVNGEKAPTDCPSFEFVQISPTNYDASHPTPAYYSKRARALRKGLSHASVETLSDLAEVQVSKPLAVTSDDAMVLSLWEASYPLDQSSIELKRPTSIALRRGDLVYSLVRSHEPYLIRENVEGTVYAPAHCAVIRCTKILPEYLCQYLSSDTGRLLREMLGSGPFSERITLKDLLELPVIVPDKPDDHYVRLFESTHYKIADFTFCYGLCAEAENLPGDESSPEEILDAELVENMVVFKEEAMQEILGNDLQELNTCYAHGAYKATLILAGSILEAVLIDWLSEIKGRNYFSDDEVYYNGRGKRVDTLAGYINEIRYLERPEWMDEAEKAFTIKDKRNLVHAKLCLKKSDINAETCEMVISYLEDVIKSRNLHSSLRR